MTAQATAVQVAVLMGTMSMVLFAGILMLMRNQLGAMFSADAEVRGCLSCTVCVHGMHDMCALWGKSTNGRRTRGVDQSSSGGQL